MENKRTYHDVEVEFGGKRIRLFDASYGLLLRCTRATGWELWNTWDGTEELLAGEYHTTPLRVFVAGVVVCGPNKLCEQRLTDDNESTDFEPSARHED